MRPRPESNRKWEPALQAGRSAGNATRPSFKRAPGWIRTSGPQVRNLVLSSAELRGHECGRRDSNPLSNAPGLQPGPTLQRRRARMRVTGRTRTAPPPDPQSGALPDELQPPKAGLPRADRKVPREQDRARAGTRTRDSRCVKPELLPLSYTGAEKVGFEPTTPHKGVRRFQRRVRDQPASPGNCSDGWTRTITGTA
jgi:hypothetical protein